MPYVATLTLTGLLGYPASSQLVTVTGVTRDALTVAGTKPSNQETVTVVLDLTLFGGD